MRLEHRAREIQRQLDSGIFVEEFTAPRREASREVQNARAEVKRLRRQVDIAQQALKPLSKEDLALGIFELPRNALASGDIGALGRQGIFHTLNPLNIDKTARAGRQMITSFLSEQSGEQVLQRIKDGPFYSLMRRSKLAIKELDDLRLRDRETVVRNNLIERLEAQALLRGKEPSALLRGLAAYMRGSERNMITALNVLRAEVFADFVRKNPSLTQAEYTAFAHYVNVTTGHGAGLGTTGDFLNRFFFSPRLIASRVQTPFTVSRIFLNNPSLRGQIVQDFSGLIAGAGAVMFLGSLAGELEFDPEDSDFLKIQVGNTRLDPFGGYGQAMRAYARTALAMPEFREIIGKEPPDRFYGSDPYSIWGTYLKYKLAPGVTALQQLITSEDVLGQPISRMEAVFRSATPILVQESVDAFRQEGALAALATFALSDIGVGVGVFDNPFKNLPVENLLKKADYVPPFGEFPDGATEREKTALRRQFQTSVATRILESQDALEALSPEQLKEQLRQIAAEERLRFQ